MFVCCLWGRGSSCDVSAALLWLLYNTAHGPSPAVGKGWLSFLINGQQFRIRLFTWFSVEEPQVGGSFVRQVVEVISECGG